MLAISQMFSGPDPIRDGIRPVDGAAKRQYSDAAIRLVEVYERVESYDRAVPFHRDMMADYETIQAWPIITLCYPGIEQSAKFLLRTYGNEVKKDKHKLVPLFERLGNPVGFIAQHYYADCLRELGFPLHMPGGPPENVLAFLAIIDGEDGYMRWRYFPSEGHLENRGPTKNSHALMLVLWAALSDIIEARVCGTRHGMQRLPSRRRKWKEANDECEKNFREALRQQGAVEEPR